MLEHALKISHLPVLTPEAAEAPTGTDAARRKAANDGARAAAGSTQVEFSSVSTLLSDGASDVDMAKVQAIREAIRNGELAINAGRIADGLIESTRDLLGRRG